MEDGLVLWYSLLLGATLSVLILIVVEDGLVQFTFTDDTTVSAS